MKNLVSKILKSTIILGVIFSFISCNDSKDNNADDFLESKQKTEIPVIPVNSNDTNYQFTAVTADGDTIVLTEDNMKITEIKE